MNVWMTLYITILFLLLTPGVLIRLSPGSSKMTVALTHAVVFGLVYHFTFKIVKNMIKKL